MREERDYYRNAVQETAAIYWVLVALAAVNSLSSLFGFVGGMAAQRGMVVFFRTLYWIMAVVTLIISVSFFIFLLVKRNLLLENCIETTQGRPEYANENVPELCRSTVTTFFVVFGVLVGVINSLEFYFATVISAYALRLKRNNQHNQLRTMEQDHPLTKNPY
ncbi:hypothetical protein DFQ28_008744 [Apophysomyces sp. BC1034]|nr:hypothetical protein DFQ29_002095 [Apophysomyces sp. BC1021]KAG0185814.1 hypothetical protein DFQ28_008744 [Apophysomyces sp. BC1034]